MVIGLTGGIASGKTLVSSMLAQKGASIICADDISHELLERETVREMVRESFGEEMFNDDGTIERKALGNLVFNSDLDRKRLEAFMHPLVMEEIFKRINKLKRAGEAVIVVDAALLVESGLYRCVDRVWVVSSSQQMDRLIKRDNLSEEEAKRRMEAQIDSERRIQHAHSLIDNSYGKEKTQGQVDDLWDSLVGIPNG